MREKWRGKTKTKGTNTGPEIPKLGPHAKANVDDDDDDRGKGCFMKKR